MTINLTNDSICVSWTLCDATQKKCNSIIHKLWDQYKIGDSLANNLRKDDLRISICTTSSSDEQPEVTSHACGYCHGDHQYIMYIYISEHFYEAPEEILETAIRKAWLGEHAALALNNDGPKPINYTGCDEVMDETTLSEYLSTSDYAKNHKEESLRHKGQYVSKLKNSLRLPLEEYIQLAINMKLITKEETEGIDYKWYKGKSGRRMLDHSVRSLKLVAIDSMYATEKEVPSYVMIYAIYIGTKLMNQPVITAEKFIDSAGLGNILNNGYSLSDMATKWLNYHCHCRSINITEILHR